MSDPRVITTLERLGVPYEIVDIDADFADTAAFCEKYGWPLDQSCNTIIVASKKPPKKYVACVVLATTRLDVNKRVTKLMEVSRASFATADEMQSLTGMQLGGVTPIGLPADLPLYVDSRVQDLDWMILGGGGRDTKVKCTPELLRALGAQFIDALAVELPPAQDAAARRRT